MTEFVLVSTQRTGSTWMVDMLDSHPNVVAYSELFLADGSGTPEWGGAKDRVFWSTFLAERGSPSDATGLLREYLDEVYAPRMDVDAIGFKLMYGQARLPELLPMLVQRAVSVVHLVRRSLDVVLSKETAAARDVYHARSGAVVQAIRIRVPTRKLAERLAGEEHKVERARQQFSALGLPYREVSYEELAFDHEQFVSLLGFLGVRAPDTPLSSSLRRLNPRSHRDLIENYDAVGAALRGTPFAAQLR